MSQGQAKTALVTGGTDGIGKEIARGLAEKGIHLLIVGRSAEQGARAEREIRQSTGNPNVTFIQADLGLMTEVDRLAEAVRRKWQSLHYLVLNAGIVLGKRQVTAEGVESHFAINYLGRFVLSCRMLPLLAAAGTPEATARIVLVSGAAQYGNIHFEDVNLTANFSTLRAVLQSCLANDLFTVGLARRLALAPSPFHATVTCVKIGVVRTNIRQGFPLWMKLVVPLLFDPLLGQTPSDAAQAALELLLSEQLEGLTGALFLKIRRLKRIEPRSYPLSLEDAERLWQLSEQLAINALTHAGPAGTPTTAATASG